MVADSPFDHPSQNSSNPAAAGKPPSPRAHVLQAADSEVPESTVSHGRISPNSPPPPAKPAPVATASPDYPPADGTDNGSAKKPAWNKPSNGGLEIGIVMGGEVWPALSASATATARASLKSISSSDSLKAPSVESSTPAAQGAGTLSPQKQSITDDSNPGNTPHSGTYTRQKSMKRGGGSSSSAVTANGIARQPSQSGPNNSGRAGSAVPDSSPKDRSQREMGQRGGFSTQSHNGSDHPQQRNTFRRGNGGPHPRGDGSSHHNYRDRGNHDWTSPRSFSGRGTHMRPQGGGSRGAVRPMPPGLSPYMHHPMPIPPFGNPVVYPEVPTQMMYGPEVLRNVPILSPLTPRLMYLPPQLHANILTQIHYYFSDINLCKDIYLRKNMDDEGWVPIELIAGFKRVRELTDNVQMILDALSTSTEVEVQGDKIRKRNDWKKWIMPPSIQFPSMSSPRSMGNSIHDPPLPNFQGLSLEERTEGANMAGEGTSQDDEKHSS